MTKHDLNVDMEAVLSESERRIMHETGTPHYYISTRRLGVPALIELFEDVKWQF